MNPNDPTQGGDQNQQPGGMGGGMPTDPNAGAPAADPNAPVAPTTDTPTEPMMPPAPEAPAPMGGDTTGTSEQPGGENPAGGTPTM